jgi:hypothetical protein
MKARASTAILMSLLLGFLLLSAGVTARTDTPSGSNPATPEYRWREPLAHQPVLRMRIGTFDPLERTPFSAQALGGGAALRLIQFPGPIQDPWYETLTDAGLEIVNYIPDYAYLVWGTGEQVRRASETLPVRWSGAYYPAYALHPGLVTGLEAPSEEGGTVEIAVQVHNHAEVNQVLADMEALATQVLRPPMHVQGTTVVGLEMSHALVAGLASLPGVISVEPLMKAERFDEIQGQLIAGNLDVFRSKPSGPGYLDWLTATVGLPTLPWAYPIVDITDDGIDDGGAAPIHPDFYELGDILRPDRLVYNVNWTTDPAADSTGGHGTLNASIVGGYNALAGALYRDAEGYSYGLGINPFGRIAGSKIFSNAGAWSYPNYYDLVAYGYAQGARIVSNSWGARGKGLYLIDDQIYDILVRDATSAIPGSQAMTIIFAAGNAGPESNTIGSPGIAKNVITVGASESYRPDWTDGCFVGPAGADNANDIIGFSSRGPTADGRVKPDLVAPGTHIVGAASQSSAYNGMSVCDMYYPVGQTLYAASSGTSHATPAVAGAVSLLTRFYQDQFGAYPSPAMLKAYLINSARYLNGISSGDTLPSYNQGYGSVDLGVAFDTTPRLVVDETTVLHATGDVVVINGTVARSDRPLRVTLAWTEPPGSVVGASYVNNLDLAVTMGEETYHGNVFYGAYSIPGGAADVRNNVESVFLPAGLEGEFTLTITATNLAGDGVPGNGDPTDQDFALVCHNCEILPSFRLTALPAAQSICQPDPAVYTITTEALAGFGGPIALQATGHPTGSTVALAPNPVEVGSASIMTITDTWTAAPGNHRISITGTAEAHMQGTFVDLGLYATVPTSVTLISPSEEEQDTPVRPELRWTPVDAADLYTVDIATSADFLGQTYTAASAITTYRVATDLEPATRYYWRVTAQNPCGAGAVSVVSSFTTARGTSFLYLPFVVQSTP